MIIYRRFRLLLFIIIFQSLLQSFSLDIFSKNLEQKNSRTPYYLQPIIDKQLFLDTIQAFKEVQYNELINESWLYEKKLAYLSNKNASFESFAQKIIILEQAEVAFWGDLHGSAHSLAHCLHHLQQLGYLNDELIIQKDNFYMFFLGDLVDRGMFGVEIMYLTLMLKIKNPHRVFLIRGNHEDRSINMHGGFQEELLTKYPSLHKQELQDIYDLYNFMPAVIYVGKKTDAVTEFIQCCHGGLEIGFNARTLLDAQATAQVIKTLNRHDELLHLPINIQHDISACIPIKSLKNCQATSPFDLGLLWNDFYCDTDQQYYFNPGRGWVFKEVWTQCLLDAQSSESSRLCAIFRAHQHNGRMLELLIQQNGIVHIFNNLVTTFLSARINGFNVDSFGVLTCSNSFNSWKLNHIVLND